MLSAAKSLVLVAGLLSFATTSVSSNALPTFEEMLAEFPAKVDDAILVAMKLKSSQVREEPSSDSVVLARAFTHLAQFQSTLYDHFQLVAEILDFENGHLIVRLTHETDAQTLLLSRESEGLVRQVFYLTRILHAMDTSKFAVIGNRVITWSVMRPLILLAASEHVGADSFLAKNLPTNITSVAVTLLELKVMGVLTAKLPQKGVSGAVVKGLKFFCVQAFNNLKSPKK